MRRLVLAFVASSSAACAMGPHIPQPNSLDQGMLIVRVQARGALIRRFSKLADTAEIVALDSFGTPVPGLRARSGMAVNGYMVFFGLPAGRYVLREASFPARGVRYRLLPNQVGEFKRSIVLRRGTVAYLGDYSFDSIWPELGVATERIVRIVAHWLTPFLKRPVIPRDANMDPYEPGPQEETRALHAVREALSESQWARLVDARLRELSASEPAKVEGALRSRAIARPLQP